MPQALCLEGNHSFELSSVSTSISTIICAADEPCANLYPNCNSKHARENLEQQEDLVQRETKRGRTKVVKTRLAQVKPAHVRKPLHSAPKNPRCAELMIELAIEDAVQSLMCDELSPPSFSSDHNDGDGDWSSALMDFHCLPVEFEPERWHHSKPSSSPCNADIFDIHCVPVTVSACM